MIIKVEATSGNKNGFRLTDPNGDREWLEGEEWARKLATKALNLYEHVYKYRRRTIRFDVR